MFFGLGLFLFGMAWFLETVGVISKDAFALIGSLLVTFSGLLKVINLGKGRKHSDHF